MEIHRLSRTQDMYLYLLAWYVFIAFYHSSEFYQWLSKTIFLYRPLNEPLNPIKVKPGPGRPGLNEKSCQIDMNRLNLFSIGDFSSWSLLYPLKKLFLQYHHKNFEKSGPKVRWLPLELGKKHELTSVSPHLITYGGTNLV